MSRKSWTDEDNQKLAELWPDMDRDQIGMILKRTGPACSHQAGKPGLKKSDAYMQSVNVRRVKGLGKKWEAAEKQGPYGALVNGARVYLNTDRPRRLEVRELKPVGKAYVSGSMLSVVV